MVVLTTLIEALIMVANTVIQVYSFIVLGACLVTWVNADPYNPIVRLLRNLTEPVLWRIRKLLPFTYRSGLDFSPVVLLVGLQVLNLFVTRIGGAVLVSLL